jgi:hypothetical protein
MSTTVIGWVFLGYVLIGALVINPLFRSLCKDLADERNFLLLGKGIKYRYRRTAYIIVLLWLPLLVVWTAQMVVTTRRVHRHGWGRFSE